MKTLIVFYTRTGRTRRIARKWAHRLGSSRLELIMMGWRNTWKDRFWYFFCTLTRKTMEIDLYNVDLAKYDRVILMVPVICGMMSAPIRTFVRQEAGNLRNVEYVLISKGIRRNEPKLVRWLDKTLGVKHLAVSSIHQSFNRGYKAHVIDGNSLLAEYYDRED